MFDDVNNAMPEVHTTPCDTIDASEGCVVENDDKLIEAPSLFFAVMW